MLCFLLSGVAALVYQTAWMREFGLLFGTSELAVATVLAAYMGGLALGARLIEPLLPRIRRYVRTYALLEIGIAASTILLVPALLAASGWLLVQWFGGQPQPPSSEQLQLSIYYLAAAFVALLIPTTLMGATLAGTGASRRAYRRADRFTHRLALRGQYGRRGRRRLADRLFPAAGTGPGTHDLGGGGIECAGFPAGSILVQRSSESGHADRCDRAATGPDSRQRVDPGRRQLDSAADVAVRRSVIFLRSAVESRCCRT